MAFTVKEYLRDIDNEIIGHRQEIAKHQLRIAQLEDMRVLMMRREDDRAELAGKVSPFGTLHGVEIAVRRPSAMLEHAGLPDGALSAALKSGALPKLPKPEKKGKKLRARRTDGLARPVIRHRVLEFFAALPPGTWRSSHEVADAWGLPKDESSRKPVNNGMYQMGVAGLLTKSKIEGRTMYQLAAQGRQALANWKVRDADRKPQAAVA